MHSARWDPSVNLKDKRVAVIGSGASATQILPELVDQNVDVTVFPGTPEWVIPRLNHRLPHTYHVIIKYVPWLASIVHNVCKILHDQLYEATHYPRSRFAQTMRSAALDMLVRQVPDEERRAMLDPSQRYPLGVRRVHLSDRIYKVFTSFLCVFHAEHPLKAMLDTRPDQDDFSSRTKSAGTTIVVPR